MLSIRCRIFFIGDLGLRLLSSLDIISNCYNNPTSNSSQIQENSIFVITAVENLFSKIKILFFKLCFFNLLCLSNYKKGL